MRICYMTINDNTRHAARQTYQHEVFTRLRTTGAHIDEVKISADDLPAQRAASTMLGVRINPRQYDVLLVDALACASVAPWLERWQAQRPLVVFYHKLPRVAQAAQDAQDLTWDAPLLRADWFITLNETERDLLVNRGVRRERIMIAPAGDDNNPDLPSWDDTSDRVANALGAAVMTRLAHSGRKGGADAWDRSHSI